MMIIRPIERRDLSDLLTLAGKSGIGLTSLPQNEDTLSARIERALKTWQGELPPVNSAICLCWKTASASR